MSDQGFSQQRSLVEQLTRATVRSVPIGPVLLTDDEESVATVPNEQVMKIRQLAVSNPTASAVTLDLSVTPKGGTKIAQLIGLSVPANDARDITALIGGLYGAGAILSAKGEGLILSGWYEAIL